ncbi:MAG TPA: hypothetical protein VG897_03705 [Terriglobales bacterium]|jgi:hypothetical protein|nr:hypothetical protein [Terriglobales bacterium]
MDVACINFDGFRRPSCYGLGIVDDIFGRGFGLVIAYVLPGLVVLSGVAPVLPAVDSWLAAPSAGDPGVGRFLYLALSALGAGLVVSCVRWLIVDTVHECSGLNRPKLDDAKLADAREAYELLIEIHYRYYQFYSNTLVALPLSYISLRFGGPLARFQFPWPELAFLFLGSVLFMGSRDALRKYYSRAHSLLGSVAQQEVCIPMTNGGHHEESGGASSPRKEVVPAVTAPKSQSPVQPHSPQQQVSKTSGKP